jgi:RimJ/RimL family protein N-acetyltransferase
VLLLVFPENIPAVRCYERVGFKRAGNEVKHFEHRGKSETLTRMAIDRGRYRRLSATRGTPRMTLPFVVQAGR